MPNNPLALPQGVRYPIQIQSQTGPADADGQLTWVSLISCVGVIATKSSREVYLASQFTGQVVQIVSIAYQYGTTITSGMRVEVNGLFFTIQTVEDVQFRHRILKLTCVDIDSGKETA